MKSFQRLHSIRVHKASLHRFSFLCFSCLLLFSFGCNINPSEMPPVVEAVTYPEGYCNDLNGSWEMVSMTVTTADSIYTQDQTEIPTLKIINDTHWMFIRQSADEFIFAQGGRYRLEEGKYIETVGYSAEPENINKEYVFDCEVIDDSWYHKGDLGSMFVDEIWQRISLDDTPLIP